MNYKYNSYIEYRFPPVKYLFISAMLKDLGITFNPQKMF